MTEQGVLRAPRVKVRGQRARAWTPCSSSITSGGASAARMSALRRRVRPLATLSASRMLPCATETRDERRRPPFICGHRFGSGSCCTTSFLLLAAFLAAEKLRGDVLGGLLGRRFRRLVALPLVVLVAAFLLAALLATIRRKKLAGDVLGCLRSRRLCGLVAFPLVVLVAAFLLAA